MPKSSKTIEPLEYPTRIGRDVYNRVSMTIQARSPIDDLTSLIISGATSVAEKPPPLKLETVTNALLVDGSLAIQNPKGNPELMADVFCPDDKTVIRYTRAENGSLLFNLWNEDVERVWTPIMTRFFLEDDKWFAKVVETSGTNSTETDLMDPANPEIKWTVPKDQLMAHPNGRGILYYAQHAYNRIEEIARDMRRTMRGLNLLPIISGNVGNATQARNAILEAEHAIIFPGEVSVDRVISESVVRQLVSESEQRQADYRDALNVIEKDTANRPVARDRELRMRVMLEFVANTRAQLIMIYAALGVKLEFSRIIVMSAAERLQELDLLDRIAGEVSTEELKRRKLQLI